MKNEVLVVMLLFVTFATSTLADSRECVRTYDFNIDFISLDIDQIPKISDYQFDSYREDDLLMIEWFSIKNTGNCTLPPLKLRLIFETPKENISHFFCMYDVRIPSIDVGGEYLLQNIRLYLPEYRDNYNSSRHSCLIKLLDIGQWKIHPTIEPQDVNVIIDSGRESVVEKGKIYHFEFKVHQKTVLESIRREYENLTLQKISIAVVILVGIVSIAVQIGTARRTAQELRRLVTMVVERIGNTVVEQIEKLNEFEKEKQRRAIRALIYELNENIKIANTYSEKRDQYLKSEKPKISHEEFILLNIQKTLTELTIKDEKIIESLQFIYRLFKVNNSFLRYNRQAGIQEGIARKNMETFLDNLSDENMQIINDTKVSVREYEKKL